MTVIVGLVRDDKIYLGGDRMITWGNRELIGTTPKVFSKGEFLIGFSGAVSTAQVLAHGFAMPPIVEGQNQETYLVSEFAPALRKQLKDLGLSKVKDNEEDVQLHLLMGFRGKLFDLAGDLSFTECVDGYDAVGSGSQFALGVLHSYKDDKKTKPEEILRKALEAAAYHNPYVAEPFDIISGAEKK